VSVPGRVFRLRLLGIAAFTAVALVVFFYFLDLSGIDVLPHSTYTLHAAAPDVVQLSNHADVLEAGVKVGTVTAINLGGGTAELTLSLSSSYGPVYRDGQIALREKTLLGENYVDLQPGNPSAGQVPSGGTLPAAAPAPVALDQILSTFDATHRRDLQQILGVLGTGLGGRGAQLGDLLGATGDLVERSVPVNAVLAADRGQVASLIADFGTVAGSLGQRAAEIQTFVRAERTAATAIASRDAALRTVFRLAPGFIAQAQRTIGHLGRFSQASTPVISELRQATGALVPAIIELRPAAAEASTVVNALGPFATVATAGARELRLVAPRLTALTGPLESMLRQVNPMMAYLAPYNLELGTLFPSMDGATHYHDASAGYGRVLATYSNDVVIGVSPVVNSLLTALQKAGVVNLLAKTQYNPYPRPGTATQMVPFTGSYPRIQPDPPYRLRR
jgi:phospholipid/cholesterol/gamma-HCH transport system substrate-binding protein